jgi:hypothetical protein
LAASIAVLAALMLLAAVGLLAVASMPFDAVRAGLDSAAPASFASRYSAAVHDALAPRLRMAGLAALIVALLAWWFRARAASAVVGTSRNALAELKSTIAYLKASLGDLPLPLLLVTAIAASLRLFYLSQPMRYDEAFTYDEYAAQPIYLLLCKYDYPNNHIFHSLCVHLTTHAFGGDPWAIRLPALVAGTLLVPAVYLAGRALFNQRAALLSSCLVACSSLGIEYSTNARGYVLVALFFVLMLAAGALVARQRTVLGWGALSLLGALGFWTIPVMLLPYGAVMLWLALSGLCSRETSEAYGRSFFRYFLTSAALTIGLTVLAYAPVLLVSGSTAVVGNKFVKPLGWAELGEGLSQSLPSTWALWHRDMPIVLPWILGVGLAIGAWRRLSLVGATMLWCSLVVVAQRVSPFERVWLFALPLYLLVASAGLVQAIEAFGASRQRLLIGAASTAVLLLGWQTIASQSIPNSTETGTLPSARELTLFLKDRLDSGDRVLARCPSDAPLEYYFKRHGVPRRYLISGTDLPTWDGARLFVVVNRAHGQTLDDFVARYRLDQFADLTSARLLCEADDASVFELVPPLTASPRPPHHSHEDKNQ